jgi:two-component system LytT family response regulator
LPDHFVQVQRSTLVNTNYVKEFRKYFRGKYILVLDDVKDSMVETGRSFSDTIKRLISVD